MGGGGGADQRSYEWLKQPSLSRDGATVLLRTKGRDAKQGGGNGQLQGALELSSAHLHTNTYTSCTPSRGFGWRIHCGVEATESSNNKQMSLSDPQSISCPIPARS
jgi:hypothetical protein